MEGERILKFGTNMNMTLGNTFFKEWELRLVTYQSVPSKTRLD